MKAAVFSPLARQELLDAAKRIAQDNPAAARAFRTALQKAALRLGEHPHLGRERSDLVHPPFRFLPVSGFPHVLVYNPVRTPPLIVRVIHGARDLPEILEGLS